MRISAITWILCTLLLMGLLAWAGTSVIPPSQRQVESGRALVGGHFELVDGKGKKVTEKDFAGKYMLVYFGFTHCPDICPTSLLLMTNAIDQLGAKGKEIVPVFITLDPERDTPEVVGNYVKHFSPRLIGLTGTPAQIKQAAEAYKVYYSKIEMKDSALGYMIDHSGYMYLMGPDGRYVAHFPHQISEAALNDALAKAVR
jgi:protein SCO1/2